MKRLPDYGRSLLIVVLLLFCSTAWAKFTFVTDAAYPPFALMNTDNTVGGFETDVIKAVCQEMRADCDFEHHGWDTLIIGVVRGRFDAAYGGMEITEERQKQVAFSDPVYGNIIALLTRTAMDIDAITPAQLDDKTVGVQRGTTFQQYLLTNYRDEVNARPYANIQEALLDLSRNRVDAVLADCPVLIE